MSKFSDLKKARKAANILVRLRRKYPDDVPGVEVFAMVRLDEAIYDERPLKRKRKSK